MMQMPAIETFNQIGGSDLGPNHTMVCCDQIKSKPPYRFAFILVVMEKATRMPVYFVTSEENPGRDGWGGPSHFLGVYDKPGHLTMAASDEFGVTDTFFPEAMRLAAARFGVSLGAKK